MAVPSRRLRVGCLAMLPSALVSVLPSATCPVCLAAYGSLLAALGLGWLTRESVLLPLIFVFLSVGLLTLLWSARGHGRYGPFLVSVVGAIDIVLGRAIWNLPLLRNVGVALLLAGSIWNLWLKRRQLPVLVAIEVRKHKPENESPASPEAEMERR